MPFPEISPYEVLEFSPTASLNDILKAYQLAIKKKRYPSAKITQAFNELKNTRKRAEHDLLTFSSLGDSSQVQQLIANLPPARFISEEMTPLPITEGITAVGASVPTDDLKQIPLCPLEVRIPAQYELLTFVLPLIPIPS